ncbi:MAG: hypothetical protein HY054_00825 [Proteobacteria bacterium]|nr:hypothetical protein [Pseudomonadota bacterium]
MRRTILGAAALLLCACGHQTQSATTSAAGGCEHSATHQVLWTDTEAPDIITVRADGPSCAQAVVSFVARNARGDPLWAFINTYHDMAIGGVAIGEAPAVSGEQMDHFLAGWATATTQVSGQLPEWREGADAVGSNGDLTYTTTHDRESYEAIRQRNLRMICFASSVAATQCLVIDPSSNAPAMIVAYGS